VAPDWTPAPGTQGQPSALQIRRFVVPLSMLNRKVSCAQCSASQQIVMKGAWCVFVALTAQPSPPGIYNGRMTLSARNKLRGEIEEIQLGDIMAHVVVRVGDNLIESVITRRSADELKLKKGDTVAAVVKATEVMIQKD
jgi:molybdopterin-binding protein